jgi:hypothetical protein
MPALKPTGLTAKITWIGHVPDRDAQLESEPLTVAELSFEGVEGEDHGGLTRPSCSRVLAQHPRGTEIRNTRQLSIVSVEELRMIAAKMNIDQLDPSWIGASMVVEGIKDFSHLPPSSRLQAPSGATVVVDMQNRPCVLPAKPIEARQPGAGASFKPSAVGLRGVTAWVERPGPVSVGDTLSLHIPDQRAWAGHD